MGRAKYGLTLSNRSVLLGMSTARLSLFPYQRLSRFSLLLPDLGLVCLI